ncbi:MAG: hypothetical protein ACI9MR_000725 [Myxococcota bacterium]|jgi:hypothetical protein
MTSVNEPSRSQPLPPLPTLGRLPSVLGSGPEKSPHRLLIAIAITILVTSGVSGLIYLRLWNHAGQDLTRLLPDDVSVYAATDAPWETIQQAIKLPQWRSPEALQAASARTGFLASGAVDHIAGVPMTLLREAQLLKATTRIEIAWVPTDEQPTLMLFVEIPDLVQRKRFTSRLQDRLETVDRHAGFRIEALWQSPWRQLVEQDIDAPRVIVMDPYIVFAWGADGGLEELVEARVGGRSDNLRAASVRGIDGVASRLVDAQLSGSVSPRAIWDAVRPPGSRGRSTMVDNVDLIRVAASVTDTHETVSVDVRTHRMNRVTQLQRALAPAPLGLIDRVPADAKLVVGASVRDPQTVAAVARDLLGVTLADVFDPAREASPREGEHFPASLALMEEILGAVTILAPEVTGALAGEFVWSLHGDDAAKSWVLIARFERPALAEQTLEQLLPSLLQTDLAYGRVRHGDEVLHLVRQANSSGADDDPEEVLAWRVREGLLEIAPRVRVLDALALTQKRGETLAAKRRARNALEPLEADPAVTILADPAFLSRLALPVLTEASMLLRPDFLVAATVHLESGWIRLASNVGPWSMVAVVSAADAPTLDRWVLAGLSDSCRAAYGALCDRYPEAVVCRPLAFGRRARLEAACASLAGASE